MAKRLPVGLERDGKVFDQDAFQDEIKQIVEAEIEKLMTLKFTDLKKEEKQQASGSKNAVRHESTDIRPPIRKKSVKTIQPDHTICVICLEHEKNIILFPCGHVCLCRKCNESIKENCPMCNQKIRARAKAFLS